MTFVTSYTSTLSIPLEKWFGVKKEGKIRCRDPMCRDGTSYATSSKIRFLLDTASNDRFHGEGIVPVPAVL